jgi:hypothetical protein
MAVRALECTSKPCRSRVYLGTPWQATSRWALCLLGTLKSEAQTHKFLVWRNATCNTDTHQCCSLLGLLLTTCWRLLAAAVNTLATLLSVGARSFQMRSQGGALANVAPHQDAHVFVLQSGTARR